MLANDDAALSRIVSDENTASDLLAYFASQEPGPFLSLLGIEESNCRFEREFLIPGRRRCDIVVLTAEGVPAGVIEVKGAADEHNGQLQVYREWAQGLNSLVVLVLAPFDQGDTGETEGWTVHTLSMLFSAWKNSETHVGWFSRKICAILDKWDSEAEMPLEGRTGAYVPKIAVRRTARNLGRRLVSKYGPDIVWWGAFGTNGPNPALFAWIKLPPRMQSTEGGLWLLLDLRQSSHLDRTRAWDLRILLEVDNFEDSDRALGLAFSTAVGLLHMLDMETLQNYTPLRLMGNSRGLKRNVLGKVALRDLFFDQGKGLNARRVGVKYQVDVPRHERQDVEDFCFEMLSGIYASITDGD